ncbi:hypothetical protein DSO57_1014963 [Entomophthora muscae]|uniref:Uncharacterized protein n=1 Tax=Entomophthora muscae TaxID=34485 RepID=A0ACC2UEM6_9FUNG|nr:hypothetical protein DSO57_1014963 [Entomophthora muscae]
MSGVRQEIPWRLSTQQRKPTPVALRRIKEFTLKKLRSPSMTSLLSSKRPDNGGDRRSFFMEPAWPFFKTKKKYLRLDRPETGAIEQLSADALVDRTQNIRTVQATGTVAEKHKAIKTVVSKFKKACSSLSPKLAGLKFLHTEPVREAREEKVDAMWLCIDKLHDGMWAGGLQLVTLKLDLDQLSYESQLWVFEGLKINTLRTLTLWNMQPSSSSMDHMARNLPYLQDLDIFYAAAPETGVKVVPEIPALQKVSLTCLDGQLESPVRIPSHHVLKNLKRLDLGQFKLDDIWRRSTFPMAPQVHQLTLYSSPPNGFIEFHFPNIKFLSYFSPQSEDLTCVSRLRHLDYLSISLTFTLPHLTSNSIKCLDIFGRADLTSNFWRWLSHSFPNLTQLRLFSTQVYGFSFPDPSFSFMPKLEAVSCQTNLPCTILGWSTFHCTSCN